ncbi:MAG: Ig-like domain-containing protein [Gemmatimonadetes bacterium]|nr:Ig-like domain-containing protein [Gemmatimonadota bacterium]
MSQASALSRTSILTACATAAILWVSACGEAAVEPTPTDPPRPTTVTVSPSSATLTVPGGTARFTAEVRDQYGQVLVGVTVAWSSSDTLVASVNALGSVKGVAEGTATIAAAVGEISDTAEITTVENPDLAALVALYEATDGPNWINNANWLTDAPLAAWYGVDTDVSGRVIRLDLSRREAGAEQTGNGLLGSIPPELDTRCPR